MAGLSNFIDKGKILKPSCFDRRNPQAPSCKLQAASFKTYSNGNNHRSRKLRLADRCYFLRLAACSLWLAASYCGFLSLPANASSSK
jgi:hypothetical protein